MSVFVAMLLGFVQGICEFLPVSSSGHLLLLQKAFGITEGGMFFSVMLHLATLIAVIVVYWDILWKLIRRPFSKLTGMLVLAVLPTVLIAVLFKKVEPFETFYNNAEQGKYLGYCFLVTSLFLSLCDFLPPRRNQRRMREMKATDALIIGSMQGVGVLAGVSRSGSTITGALLAGLDRKSAADFSFLLSIPAILGGAILEIPDALKEGVGDMHWACVFFGMVTAGLTGYFAIRFMLQAIKKKRLWGFGVYTAILGLFVLADQYVLHWITW